MDNSTLEQLRENPLAVMDRAVSELEERMGDGGFIPTHSNILEEIDPSESEDSDRGLDAFNRLLREEGIPVNTDRNGSYISATVETFLDNNFHDPYRRLLLNEYLQRSYRSAILGQEVHPRATYLSTDSLPGSWLRPYAEATAPRQDRLVAPQIPLASLIAMTTPVASDDYRAFYFEYDEDQLRTRRVGESAELPLLKLTKREHAVPALKYGFALEASYEALRRERVNRLAWHIRMAAVQDEIDKVVQAMSILINGDGNVGTPAQNFNQTTFDPAAITGNVSIKGWQRFKMQFKSPYVITTALMQETVAASLIFMDTGSTNQPLTNLPTFAGQRPQALTPINITADGVRYGWEDSAPTNTIIGFDANKALEQIVEIGSNISEMDRFIRDQTQLMTFSEVTGFMLAQPGSNKTLTLD